MKPFPSPEEVRSTYDVLAAARIESHIEAIRAAVTKERGAGRIIVNITVANRDQPAVRAAIEPAGWEVLFFCDQRDGAWVQVTARS